MKTIGIIINPRARSVKKSRVNMADLFEREGGDLVDVRKTGTLDELEQACMDFKRNRYSYIGISGGDGTIHQVITRLINVYLPGSVPPVVLLGGGTMNNIVRDLDLRGTPQAVLSKLVAALKQGSAVATATRDTIKIDNCFGFIFGIGVVTNILNAAYDCADPGPLRNLVVIATALRDGIFNREDSKLFTRIQARVHVDDDEIPFADLLGVIAGTVEHKGMGFHLLPRANEKRGTFQVLISGLKPRELARQVLRAKKGIPLKGALNYNNIGNRVRIFAENDISYTIDGDLYNGSRELIIETGPEITFVEI
ncbi:MAG TPA: diacylglycerol kinase family protein [Spirochaetota bacterium]|nr:diacylglycerol kinase family protein [Spirochaetota bacterium]HPI90979.1 diacylglycerol kinase family protein [Spirochaetota bacterium]HPR47506.1 diacylglycerol kinase family protein [Spirochaetota bacterium]